MSAEYKNTGIKQRVIDEIIMFARKYDVETVILFGSRARGDCGERSDIDLAFSGGDKARFVLDVDEETYTLLKFDFVDLDAYVQPELKAAIEKDGVVLYEKMQ
ncbi:MAG: nucleotidyltransferase domain-containing protein [Firmicutes bacterium]|nr:nucleotidyltransferase domain-containing protein [Bacillota bacterium]MBQ9604641.1 nucleotidyltransferase domain-containing protein [Bacillota bacterium]